MSDTTIKGVLNKPTSNELGLLIDSLPEDLLAGKRISFVMPWNVCTSDTDAEWDIELDVEDVV